MKNITKLAEIHLISEFDKDNNLTKYKFKALGKYKHIYSLFSEFFNDHPDFYKELKIIMEKYNLSK